MQDFFNQLDELTYFIQLQINTSNDVIDIFYTQPYSNQISTGTGKFIIIKLPAFNTACHDSYWRVISSLSSCKRAAPHQVSTPNSMAAIHQF